MIIDQLPEISDVQETDEIPVERGTTTYKTTIQKLKDLAEYKNPTRLTNIVGMSGVTINENRSYRIGKLVIVSIRFTLSELINANSTALQGFPAPASSLSAGSAIVSLASNRAGIPFAMVGSGEAMPTVTASPQMYVISGCYIAAN